jgi:hypothetical protein
VIRVERKWKQQRVRVLDMHTAEKAANRICKGVVAHHIAFGAVAPNLRIVGRWPKVQGGIRVQSGAYAVEAGVVSPDSDWSVLASPELGIAEQDDPSYARLFGCTEIVKIGIADHLRALAIAQEEERRLVTCAQERADARLERADALAHAPVVCDDLGICDVQRGIWNSLCLSIVRVTLVNLTHHST